MIESEDRLRRGAAAQRLRLAPRGEDGEWPSVRAFTCANSAAGARPVARPGGRAWARRRTGAGSQPLAASAEGGVAPGDASSNGADAQRAAAISQLHTRSDAHWSRKLFHSLGGLAIAAARVGMGRSLFLTLFGALLCASFVVEFIRLNVGGFVERAFLAIGGKLMRDNEADKFTTTCYFQLGVVLASWLFSTPCAVLAIVTLAVGDPIASVAGRASASLPPSRLKSVLRTKTVGSKSVAGSLAFLIAAAAANAAALAAAAALAPAPAAAEFALALPRAAAAALAAALAGAVAELCANDSLVLPWKRLPLTLDDNLTIPLAAGAAAALLL